MNRTSRAFALSVMCFVTLSALSSSAFPDPLAENQTRFGVVTGQVELLPQGAAEWIDAHEDLPIETGDHIRTGDDSRAEIIVSQNAVWVLEPDSDLLPEHMEENAGHFNLPEGTLLGKVDSGQATAAQHWEFNTPAAVCGVRGTEFAISASPQGTDLGVLEGEVDMSTAESAEGPGTSIKVGPRQEALAGHHPLKVLKSISPSMKEQFARFPDVRTRLRRVQSTWSPTTPAVRKELRGKFVSPKNRLIRHAPVQRRRTRKVTTPNDAPL